jgi:cysteinyl-tRNA synthetase
MNKIILALLAIAAVNAVFVKRGATDPNMAVYAQLE